MQRGFNIKLNLSDIQAVKTADYPSIALRPQYSCLNSQKIVQTLNVTLPHWQQGVDGVLDILLSTEHSFYV
jgi:dTDP-4-dehydrorhamnose reductase